MLGLSIFNITILVASTAFSHIECARARTSTSILYALNSTQQPKAFRTMSKKELNDLVKMELSNYEELKKNQTVKHVVLQIIARYERKIEEIKNDYEIKEKRSNNRFYAEIGKVIRLENDQIRLLQSYTLDFIASKIRDYEVKYLALYYVSKRKMMEIMGLTEDELRKKVSECYERIKSSLPAEEFTIDKTLEELELEITNITDKALYERLTTHYLRWKYIFKVSTHSGVTRMKNVTRELNMKEDEVHLELSFLFAKSSINGIRVPPPFFRVELNTLIKGLQYFDLDYDATIKAVKILYSNSY